MLRFHFPLVEPDVQISRIRLSDKASIRRLTIRCSTVTPSVVPGSCREFSGNQSPSRRHLLRCPELRLLPSTGITRLQRYYGPLRHPQCARPVPHGRPVGSCSHAKGLPVLHRSSCCTHAVTNTPVDPWERSSLAFPQVSAFPVLLPGRHPHYIFRGLLGVHSRYGLRARGVPKGPFTSKASAASLPPQLLRLLPAGAKVAGRESHPLKDRKRPRTPVLKGLA